MTGRQLYTAIGSVDPALVEAADEAKAGGRRFTLVKAGWVAAAAGLMLVAGIVATQLISQPGPLPQAPQMTAAGDTTAGAAARDAGPEAFPEAAMFEADIAEEIYMDGGEPERHEEAMVAETRRFLNYNGFRYAFIETASTIHTGRELGVLEHDIRAASDTDTQANDLAASYAIGGTVYEIPDYDSRYRVAVLYDGMLYMAELTGTVDGTHLGADYFFEVSKLRETAAQAYFYSHLNVGPFAEVEDLPGLLDILSSALPFEPDYAAITDAQTEGRFRRLELILGDGTNFPVYAIPDLGYVTIGDDYYILPDERIPDFAALFDGLEQGSPVFD